jgi:N6-L-threonylcarbamoyladenine synthase
MPCKPREARLLLKSKKAKVIKRNPFTIILLYGSSGYKQDIILGVDCGNKYVGISATTNIKELYNSITEIRDDVSKLISDRNMYRKFKRYRLRYRKMRHNNRIKNMKKGWLPPSIKHKINTHLQLINNIYEILPINKLTIEIATFDIQKLKNPDIDNEEYQLGSQFGFYNLREYILFRDNHMCQNCFGKSKDKILNVHHIETAKTGGSAPNNLITLCKTCHHKYHMGEIKLSFKRTKSYKYETFINIMRRFLYEELNKKYKNINITYGYITKLNRIDNKLPNHLYNNSYCISHNFNAKQLPYYFFQKQTRKHNRQIHKANLLKGGKRKINQCPYIIYGFRLYDKVLYDNIECFIFGRRREGYFKIQKLDGAIIKTKASYKKLKLLEKRKAFLTERRQKVVNEA